MNERYFWTMPEVKALKEHYHAGGAAACRERLPNRSERAIYAQARHLGLKYKNGRRPRLKYETTEEIDQRILDCYQNHPAPGAVKRLAHSLRRPFWWVKKRAMHLGLARPNRRDPEWTEPEIALLAKHAHKTPEVIRRILLKNGFRRTANAIMIKCRRLHLDTLDTEHYTARSLAREFGVDSHTVTRWIEQGWLKASRRGTQRIEAQHGDHWWIKRKDVHNFIKETFQMIDFRKVDKTFLVDLLANP